MRNFKYKTLLFLLLLSLQFTYCSDNSSQENQKAEKLFADYFEERLQLFPSEAASIGDYRFDDKFENSISQEHLSKQKELYQKYLKLADRIDSENLNSETRLYHEVFVYSLRMKLEHLKYPEHLLPVNHMFSVPSAFIQMASGKGDHQFRTVKNYEDFLSKIDGFVDWVNTAIDNMNEGIQKQIVQPKIIVEHMVKQYSEIIKDDIKETTFYDIIKNMPEDFSDENKSRLTNEYEKAIENKLLPIYRKLLNYLEVTYLPAARESIGLSELPNGKEWYKFRTKLFTTTNLSPDEIFELGENEVARIEKAMNNILKKNGFENNIGGFFQDQTQKGLTVAYSNESDLIKAYKELKEKINPQLDKYFSVVPKGDFEIRPIEAYRAATASDSYQAASPDGSRPGIFYLNTFGIEQRPKPVLESLFIHEAIPGHHFQITITREKENLPKFIRFQNFTAYVEGWGLYTESLGYNLGLYKNDTQVYIRYIFEMLRATRLVVDVGIHYKGWTRDQAIQYLQSKNPAAGSGVSATDRYIAIGGQALAYKIGELKIHELIKKYNEQLGSEFTLKKFHDEFLKDGSMPLNILENKMDSWAEGIN